MEAPPVAALVGLAVLLLDRDLERHLPGAVLLLLGRQAAARGGRLAVEVRAVLYGEHVPTAVEAAILVEGRLAPLHDVPVPTAHRVGGHEDVGGLEETVLAEELLHLAALAELVGGDVVHPLAQRARDLGEVETAGNLLHRDRDVHNVLLCVELFRRRHADGSRVSTRNPETIFRTLRRNPIIEEFV